MNLWEYFWIFVVGFSVMSFTYMSLKIIVKGYSEMKEMFKFLNN